MAKVFGKKKSKLFYLMMGAVVLLAIISIIISNLTKTQELPTINVIAVKTGDVQETVDTSGTVVSQNKKTFFSPVNAQIQTLNLTVGDSVSAGTRLVDFNLEDLETQNQKAELSALSAYYTSQDSIGRSNATAADKAQAVSDVNTLQSQVDGKRNEITNIQNQITNTVNQAAASASAEVTNQLNTLNIQLTGAKDVQLEKQSKYNTAVAAEAVARTKMQQESSAKNITDFEEAATKLLEVTQALSEATTAVESIQTEISNLGASSGSSADTSGLETQLTNAQSELSELQAKLSSAQAIVDSADASILSSDAKSQLAVSNNLAELEAKTIEELIEEGRKGINAEFTGVITSSLVAEGATVTQGMELFTLESTEDVNVNITISKYDLEKVAVGQSAQITIAGNEYKGTLTRINKMATTNEQGTIVLEAAVHIDNPDQNIFLGVEGKVIVQGTEAKNVLLVPTEVINVGTKGSFCYVVEDGIIVRKDVETGISSDDYMEIKSGLNEGDSVITDNADTFTEGQEAEPVEALAEAQTES